MASIGTRQTKQGRRWDVRWRDYGDANQQTRTFHTAEAARAFAREVERARDERRPFTSPHAPPLTLRALATRYLLDRKRIARSAESLEQREMALAMFIDWIEDVEGVTPQLWHLTKQRLAGYHAHLLTPRRVTVRNRNDTTRTHTYRCSAGTANARVRYVEAWWRWLADDDELHGVPVPRRIDLAEPPAPPPQVPPTWAEMGAAIACARPEWARLLSVLYFTGLRTGQAFRLLRSDVDLDAATLTVRGELGKSKQERAGRVVPLSPHFVALLRTWPADPDGWLVRWDAKSPRYTTTVRAADPDTARRILQRAGVRPEVWQTRRGEARSNAHPLHCYRAGFISGLAALGVDERAIKKLVGHSGGVTLDRYTMMELRELVEKIPPLPAAPRILTLREYRVR